jgi:hypothetical protein
VLATAFKPVRETVQGFLVGSIPTSASTSIYSLDSE